MRVFEKDIAALTDGPDDIVDFLARVGGDVLDAVIGIVEGRANEVGHARIDDDETFLRTLLDVSNARDETATLRDDATSRLAMERLTRTKVEVAGEETEIGLKLRHRKMVRMLVVDAKSTANIDVRNADTLGIKGVLEFVDANTEVFIGGEVSNLTSDVEVNADELEMGGLDGETSGGQKVIKGKTKFVFVKSRSNLLMRVGINVRVNAQGDTSNLALQCREVVNDLKFRHGLGVKAEDVGGEGVGDFTVGLAYSRKDNGGSGETRGEGGLYLIAADAVGTESVGGDETEDVRVGVRLDSVVNLVAVFIAFRAYRLERGAKESFVVVIEGCRDGLELINREVALQRQFAHGSLE